MNTESRTATAAQFSDELCPVAKCCLISAKMLEIADESEPDTARRLRLKKFNAGQARLLTEAARQAEDMAIDNANMLSVLQWIAEIADKTYEQDDKLRSNGARTLIRISDRARACIAAFSGTVTSGEPATSAAGA